MTGSVTDAQGLALPGATVVLRTTGGVFAASTITGRAGGFALEGVPAGDYVLAASLLGFRRHEEPVTVAAGAALVAITLDVGSFSTGGAGHRPDAGGGDGVRQPGIGDRTARRPGPRAVSQRDRPAWTRP